MHHPSRLILTTGGSAEFTCPLEPVICGFGRTSTWCRRPQISQVDVIALMLALLKKESLPPLACAAKPNSGTNGWTNPMVHPAILLEARTLAAAITRSSDAHA